MKLYSSKQYNRIANIKNTNCFAFVFGITENQTSMFELISRDPDGERIKIEKAFISQAKKFGIDLKQVNSLEEAKGKDAFILWGWYRNIPLFGISDDFHVARKNSDGTFEHKAGFGEPAENTTLEKLTKEYPEQYKVFILNENFRKSYTE